MLLFIFFLSLTRWAQAQDDLMDLLDAQSPEPVHYTAATFKGSRLINGHTVETRKQGALEFIIGHRFGRLNSGAYEFFGLDGANIRLGLEYGLADFLNVGVGRNSFEKTYDGFLKLKLLRQSSGARWFPVSVVAFSSAAIKTLASEEDLAITDRLFYTHQLLIGRKWSDLFSLQLMPTLAHRNQIQESEGENDVYALGIGGRIKLTSRVSLNGEYYYRMDVPEDDLGFNSVAIGFDIETGGHVFQLHLTNSRAIIEKGFITETTGNFFRGRYSLWLQRISSFLAAGMKKIRRQFLALLTHHDPRQAEDLGGMIDREFSLLKQDVAFAKHAKNPMDRRMPTAAYLLAIVKVLHHNEFSDERIRELILALAYEHARPKNSLQRLLKTAVPGFITSTAGRYLLARMNAQLKKSPRSNGFVIDIITAKEKTLGYGYGVDILECGICKLFAKHQYQAYAPLLCEVDYITSSLAGLKLIRSGTIANGAAVCDFRYEKIA